MENNKTFIERANAFLLRLQSISDTDKMFFAQHMGVMIKAGIPIAKAIKTLSLQTDNQRFSKVLLEVYEGVEKGETLAASLKKHKNVFGDLFINMISSGEVSGKLEEVLSQIYIQLKKRHELISKIRNALIYPVIVVLAMFGIGAFMMVFVIPKIINVFEGFQAKLPVATKILITISRAINQHGIIVASSIIISGFLFIRLLKTKQGKYVFDILILKLPLIASIIKKINLALLSRTLSSLIKTDIPIVQSFSITAEIMGNSKYRQELLKVSEAVKKGISIAEAMRAHDDIFPPVILQMVSVGEETGSLDDILEEIALFYEEEVHDIMDTLPSVIEPVLMLLLGGAVAFMAVAIIMPMYSLTQAM
ncbi:MAG: type II secretion system F family protein [bacterium]